MRFHSFKLKDSCRRWSPCEIEALALAAGIEKEIDLLRETKKPVLVHPDNKPVHQAIELINRGNFSASARMSSFLTNINRIPIISKHISGKAKLNIVADLQSRTSSDCPTELCSIHKFVSEAMDGVIENKESTVTENKLLMFHTDVFNNKVAWKKAQENNAACGYAKHLLSTGKPPPKAAGKMSGKYFNKV